MRREATMPSKNRSTKAKSAKVKATKAKAEKLKLSKLEAAKVEAAKVEAAKVAVLKVDVSKVEAAEIEAGSDRFPRLFSVHRHVQSSHVKEQPFQRRANFTKGVDHHAKMRDIVCDCISKTYVAVSSLDIEHWNAVETELNDPKTTEKSKREDVLQEYGDNKRNILMLTCMLHPPLRIVKLMLKHGGEKALTGNCGCGFNALHYACYANASQEVIQYLVDIGGEEALLKKSTNGGATPLHVACQQYSTDSLVDVIQLLIRAGKHGVLNITDNNKEIPLHCMLLRAGKLPVEAIIAYLDMWYGVEQETNTILSFNNKSWKSRDPDQCKRACLAFNRTLGQLQNTSIEDQGRILKTPFMKTFLTRKFIQPVPLAIIMMDLYVQIIIVYVLSFSIHNESSDPTECDSIKFLLGICITWRLLREIVQVMTNSLGDYLSNVSNWVDICQITLIMIIISMSLDSHFTSPKDRFILAFTTFNAWFELLMELHNFIYDLAIFVVATIQVLKHLVPFLFSTGIYVMAFAHMYLIAGPNDKDLCNSQYNLTDVEYSKFIEDGGWACSRKESIEFSSNIFFNFDIPNGVPLGITYAFACVMSIFLLNVLVAVISQAFDNVQSECETIFWSDRLSIVDEVQEITSFFSMRTFSHQPRTPNNNSKCDSDNDCDDDRKCDNNNGSKCENDDGWDDGRCDFNFFLEPLQWSQLSQCDDQPLLYWWYGKTDADDPPPLISRLSFFFRKSVWKEILFPGVVFENILLGSNRSGETKGVQKILTFLGSLILMVVSNVLVMSIFMLGLMSFGLLWPKKMKEVMFTVYQNADKISDEPEKTSQDIIDLKNEICEMREEHTNQVSEIRNEFIDVIIQMKENHSNGIKDMSEAILSKMDTLHIIKPENDGHSDALLS